MEQGLSVLHLRQGKEGRAKGKGGGELRSLGGARAQAPKQSYRQISVSPHAFPERNLALRHGDMGEDGDGKATAGDIRPASSQLLILMPLFKKV